MEVSSLVGDLIRHDEKSEYVFKFKIKDLKKKEAKGNFHIEAKDARFVTTFT